MGLIPRIRNRHGMTGQKDRAKTTGQPIIIGSLSSSMHSACSLTLPSRTLEPRSFSVQVHFHNSNDFCNQLFDLLVLLTCCHIPPCLFTAHSSPYCLTAPEVFPMHSLSTTLLNHHPCYLSISPSHTPVQPPIHFRQLLDKWSSTRGRVDRAYEQFGEADRWMFNLCLSRRYSVDRGARW